MTIRFFRNYAITGQPRLKIAHLPIRQTLVWLGPIFILIQVKRA